MRETIIYCDCCNNPGAKSYKYRISDYFDENKGWFYKDLCKDCLHYYIKSIGIDNIQLVDEYKEKIDFLNSIYN